MVWIICRALTAPCRSAIAELVRVKGCWRIEPLTVAMAWRVQCNKECKEKMRGEKYGRGKALLLYIAVGEKKQSGDVVQGARPDK